MAQLRKGQVEEALEWLAELSRLEPDWDSYGALSPAHQAVDQSRALIGLAVAQLGRRGVPHDIMPIADGGIALEWRYPSVELGLNARPEGGWTSLQVRSNAGGRRFDEAYDLSDDDALALLVRVVANAPA